ncbi:TPA: hypothetical protein ACRRXO_000320 [Morganella morganii]
MKKITIISALVAASLLLGACDKTKAADNGQGERYAAPFGLTWGMTEEALVPRLGSQSETDNSEYVCPLTKVTSKTFSGGLNEAGEYEFRFLPQYGQPDFSGLVGIGYFYSTDDEAAYQTQLKELQHNLEAEYGKPSILESKKADEEHFIYKSEENEISLFVMMRNARFYISLDYSYFPKEHQVSLKNNIQKIKETCIKQRGE